MSKSLIGDLSAKAITGDLRLSMEVAIEAT